MKKLKIKKSNAWGVRCDICNYQFYKGSPMTDKELSENMCIHGKAGLKKWWEFWK